MSNASKSVATATENATQPTKNTTSSQTFQQIENIASDMGNATESAIAGARDQIEETVSGTQSALANATEGAENATEGAENATEGAENATEGAATNATEGYENATERSRWD